MIYLHTYLMFGLMFVAVLLLFVCWFLCMSSFACLFCGFVCVPFSSFVCSALVVAVAVAVVVVVVVLVVECVCVCVCLCLCLYLCEYVGQIDKLTNSLFYEGVE